MNKICLAFSLFCIGIGSAVAQHIKYEEYTLKNGLHVILHQDRSAPVVTSSVMYHVGSKDENTDRTGFAHFFEHLLFEGSENIKRGQWDVILSSNGGQGNANTNDDRTYYFQTFPSNNLEISLWMESERMLHPVINKIGVDTQREVVKEEKRLRVDNQPYGSIWEIVKKNIFINHPYRWTTIGSMEHLDAATLDEFKTFFSKYYVPNNAVLTIVGDFETVQLKKWIDDYFGTIPRGIDVKKLTYTEEAITKQINVTYEDPNIQLPMLLNAYRIPSMTTREVRVLDVISSILSNGNTSRLYKRLVDKDKIALEAASFSMNQEDYGIYLIYGIPITGVSLQQLQVAIDEEIKKLCTELISKRELEKLKNQYENAYVNQNATTEGIAANLAEYYLLHGDTKLINEDIEIYRSITRDEIREVANRYLQPNQRLVLDYIPKK
ncbi:MAG: hypothetical protein RL662_1768 [Bacteroidota bacterium]|jgi:predicted Zn-dependent peptidase